MVQYLIIPPLLHALPSKVPIKKKTALCDNLHILYIIDFYKRRKILNTEDTLNTLLCHKGLLGLCFPNISSFLLASYLYTTQS